MALPYLNIGNNYHRQFIVFYSVKWVEILSGILYFTFCFSVFLQMFLAALSFAYFAKASSGSYMKSTITQLERRFDIPSYLIGIIDGSFEIGQYTLFFSVFFVASDNLFSHDAFINRDFSPLSCELLLATQLH